jgi:uncharacterized membrane protein
MTGVAIALAAIMHAVDKVGKYGLLEKLGWGWCIYNGEPDAALTMLSTIANSMITVAVTAFSVTLVALSLASQQFGSRVLRNFMQDKSYQLVLGTFTATFVYCVLVIRGIHSDKDKPFIPHISLTVALILMLLSIGMLIYFIHHATTSIHAWHIIKKISSELNSSIDKLFCETFGYEMPRHKQQPLEKIQSQFQQKPYSIKATYSGYIQAIDHKQLMKIAVSKNLLLWLKKRPGKFVVQGNELIVVSSNELVNQRLAVQLSHTFILGEERTANQDVEFSIRQLVEIAIRAISPAVNDPFTALRCIDQLCAALCRLGTKEFPSPYRYDNENNLRIISNAVTFDGLIDDAFHQIRQYGRSDVAVTIRLLEAIALIAQHTHNNSNRAALLRHAKMIQRGSQQGLLEESDRKDVETRYQAVLKVLSFDYK